MAAFLQKVRIFISVDIPMLYLVATVFKLYIDHCKSSSKVAMRTRSSANTVSSI